MDENVLDRAAIDSLRELGDDLVEEVRGLFVAEIPPLIRDVEEAARRNQPEAMWKAAHAIRSVAGNAGAVHLARLCDEVQALGYGGSVEGGEVLARELWVEFEKARAALEKI